MFSRGDADPGDRRFDDVMIREPQRELLHVIDRILPRQRVHDVLHRIGRMARGVVAVDVDLLERAFELDVDGEIDELVLGGGALDLHQPHARFAVTVPAQRHKWRFHVPLYVLYPKGLTSSGM